MTLRSLAIIAVLPLAGCVSSQVAVSPAADKAAAKAAQPSAKFQEYITVPGQYVAANPAPGIAAERGCAALAAESQSAACTNGWDIAASRAD